MGTFRDAAGSSPAPATPPATGMSTPTAREGVSVHVLANPLRGPVVARFSRNDRKNVLGRPFLVVALRFPVLGISP